MIPTSHGINWPLSWILDIVQNTPKYRPGVVVVAEGMVRFAVMFAAAVDSVPLTPTGCS